MEFFEKLNDVLHFLVWFHFYFFSGLCLVDIGKIAISDRYSGGHRIFLRVCF